MRTFYTLLFFFHLLIYGQTVEDSTECMNEQKDLALLDLTEETFSKAKEHVPKCSTGGKAPLIHQKPMDCSEVLENGGNKSGVYTIWPRSRFYCNKSLDVYCDMETDSGGWTVIERRKNYFYDEQWERLKERFENGFGNLTQDFYIGNKPQHALTNQGDYERRVEYSDIPGNKYAIITAAVWMDDSRTNYTIHGGPFREIGNPRIFTNTTSFSLTQSIRRNCTYVVTSATETTSLEPTIAETTQFFEN